MKQQPFKVPFLANDLRFAKALSSPYLTKRVRELCGKFGFNKTIRLKMVESFEPVSLALNIFIPNWVIGLGLGDEILILNPERWNNNITMEQLILHESVHIILAEYCNASIPAWLNEGLATFYAGQDCGFPGDDLDVNHLDYSTDNFYAKAKAVVEKAIEDFGETVLLKELKNWNDQCTIMKQILKDCG